MRINVTIRDIIDKKRIESNRLEFKRSWSEQTFEQVMKTITAFANDFQNTNGGYILVGIDDAGKLPDQPTLDASDVSQIVLNITNRCKGSIQPAYVPIIELAYYQDHPILVIFAPPGEARPYQSLDANNKKNEYWVRVNNQTIKAQGELLTQFLNSVHRVPYDDQRNFEATTHDISVTLVKSYLHKVESKLLDESLSDEELYERMGLLARVNGHSVPKNFALLLFSEQPRRFFPGAFIQVAQFSREGDVIEEHRFEGPIDEQIRQALRKIQYLTNVILQKRADQPEVDRFTPFPPIALEEAIVNAFYHRGYERSYPDPITVYLYPDQIDITSYPGPLQGITQEDFQPNRRRSRVPHRNRVIGEYLKNLRLVEGYRTGINKIYSAMEKNGSPPPQFLFEESRSFFSTILPAHPYYTTFYVLREVQGVWARGERQLAIDQLRSALERSPFAPELLAQLIGYYGLNGEIDSAEKLYQSRYSSLPTDRQYLLFLAMINSYLDVGRKEKALLLLRELPSIPDEIEQTEIPALYKRLEFAYQQSIQPAESERSFQELYKQWMSQRGKQ